MGTELDALQVLVVEDEETYQRSAEAIVRSRVADAHIDFATDFTTALPAILHRYYDVLILDLVLHPNPTGPLEEWEGIWIIQELFERGLTREIKVFVLTAHAGATETAKLLFNYDADDIWEKKTRSEQHSVAFQRALERHNAFGCQVKVEFIGGLDWSVLVDAFGIQFWRITADVSREEAELELRHLLRRLFATKASVRYAPFGNKGVSGAGVVLARPMGAEGTQEADLVVKYGAFEYIVAEIAGWTSLRPFMKGQRFTHLEHSALGRKLGAIAYSFVGVGDVRPLSDVYASASIGEVRTLIASLFAETCGLWYEAANRKRATSNLEPEYASYLGFSREKIREALRHRYPENPVEHGTVEFAGVPRRFEHPVAAFCDGKVSFEIETWLARTHGDLHTGNIFVDTGRREAWLIDFGRSGIGHWARDFVELETCLKFQHLPSRDLPSFFKLETQLLRPDRLSDEIEYEAPDEPELTRMANAVASIRQQAGELIKEKDSPERMLDYYTALFFHTINYVRLYRLIDSPVKKNRVLLSAAMLYEKISPRLGPKKP
jgi:CheY-like chemotaxis protein